MNPHTRPLFAALVLSLALATSHAASTKDIVLDRIAPPVVGGGSGAVPVALVNSDAMAVSVLLESPDGSLSPKGTDSVFRTGDRFRVKVLASRDARVSLYNTNPRGETNPTPLWQGEVRRGQDTITPRLRLAGNSGVDLLHIVLEPREQGGVAAWLGQWLRGSKDGSGASKDIQLDVQNTASATYLVNTGGQGLVSTVSIVHTR